MARKAVAFSAVMVALVVLSLEGLARVFLDRLQLEDVVPISIGRFDPNLGWSLQPNSHAVSTRTGQVVEYSINSKGLRDDETTYAKPGDVFRIVTLGDSNTFGFGISINEHFTTLLEERYRNVEVINMGVDGFGVDQELLFLTSEGFRYEPDLVLAYVPHYADERHMHTRRFEKQKPKYVLRNAKLSLTNHPVPFRGQPGLTLWRIHRWFIINSRFYFTMMRLGRKAWKRLEQANKKAPRSTRIPLPVHELGEAIVYEMQSESTKHEAIFVLVTKIQRLHTRMLGRNAYSLNVASQLADASYKLPGFEHLSFRGNQILTKLIGKFLEEKGLIPYHHLKERP
jgi:hypothetical protein